MHTGHRLTEGGGGILNLRQWSSPASYQERPNETKGKIKKVKWKTAVRYQVDQATEGGTGNSRSLLSRKHVAVESPEWWINKLLPCPAPSQPAQGTLRPPCDRIIATVPGAWGLGPGAWSLGVVWRREALGARQEMSLIRTRAETWRCDREGRVMCSGSRPIQLLQLCAGLKSSVV